MRPDVAALSPLADTLPPSDCQPAVAAMYVYWRRIGPPDRLPGRQHLDPAAIVPLLRHLWLLDVVRAPRSGLRWHFRYRLVGTEIAQGLGRDPTGVLFHEVWPRTVGRDGVYDDLLRVVEQREARFRRGPTLYDDTRSHKWVERILLPLARDGATIDMILGLTLFLPAPDLETGAPPR